MAMAGRLKVRTWAKSRGVAPSTASRAGREGRLPVSEDGLMDADEADGAFVSHPHIGNGRGERGGALHAYQQARAERERTRAEREALALARERDGAVPVPEVDRMLCGIAAATAGPLRQLVARAAAPLAMQETSAIQKILRVEIERTLADLERLVEDFLQKHEARTGRRRRKKGAAVQ